MCSCFVIRHFAQLNLKLETYHMSFLSGKIKKILSRPDIKEYLFQPTQRDTVGIIRHGTRADSGVWGLNSVQTERKIFVLISEKVHERKFTSL